MPWRACLCRKLGNPLRRKLNSGVCCLRLLNVMLVYSPTPGHIIQTVWEEWQWKLWQRMLYLSLSEWTALCTAVGLFSAPCLKERMAPVSSQMRVTVRPLQTFSATKLSRCWVPVSVSKPSLFLMSQLQERATATSTLLCCILMCTNQLNASPDFISGTALSPNRCLPSSFSCSSWRCLREQIGRAEVTSKETERN